MFSVLWISGNWNWAVDFFEWKMEEKQPLSLYSNKAMDIQFDNVWLRVRQGKGKIFFIIKLKLQYFIYKTIKTNILETV